MRKKKQDQHLDSMPHINHLYCGGAIFDLCSKNTTNLEPDSPLDAIQAIMDIADSLHVEQAAFPTLV